MIKRIFDITFALLGLLISFPLLILISICIKLDSKGSILFKQKRVGLNGKPFAIYKFRTMVQGAQFRGPKVTRDKDNRVTKLGYFLRKYKIDELPQFINIVKGEMSFVGPRPEHWDYKDLFQGEYSEILEYIPGIFGPNQIAYRNESYLYPLDDNPESYYKKKLFPQKAQSDLNYFENANFFKDISWILKGVWASVFKATD